MVPPNYEPEVMKIANLYQIPYGPGCTTYSESLDALKAGAAFIKAFPIPLEVLKSCKAKQCTLPDLLQTSDYITIHVPLTKETTGLIGMEELKTMKESAILVNASRGGIVKDKDALEALKYKGIKAYAADVFEDEPPTKEGWQQELLALDSFYLTAHIGSRSQESEINTVNRATDILYNFFSSQQ